MERICSALRQHGWPDTYEPPNQIVKDEYYFDDGVPFR